MQYSFMFYTTLYSREYSFKPCTDTDTNTDIEMLKISICILISKCLNVGKFFEYVFCIYIYIHIK